MNGPESQLAAKIAVIKQAFFARLRHDWIPKLRALRQRFIDNPWDAGLYDELLRTAHDMTGTGAVFGCAEVSSMGRQLEDRLRVTITSGRAGDTEHRDILRMIDQLEAVCVAALRGETDAPPASTTTAP
jgi:hypothetical protein